MLVRGDVYPRFLRFGKLIVILLIATKSLLLPCLLSRKKQ